MSHFKTLFTLASLSFFSSSIYAVDIRGFGTGGMVKTDSQYSLGDYGTMQDAANFSQFTRLGINLHQVMNNEWSASAQLLATANTQTLNEFLEWGFVSYAPIHEVSVRAGRMVAPIWLYSQQINVGFSYPWVILPVEVYSLNPIRSLNGISSIAQAHLGVGLLQGQLFMGEGSTSVPGFIGNQSANILASARDAIGAELSYNIDEKFMFRLSYMQAQANVTTTTPFSVAAGTLSATQPTLNLKTDTYSNLGRSEFFSAGMKADYQNIFFASEFARRLTAGWDYHEASGAYAAVGYHYNKFMPLFTWSWQGALLGTSYFHPNYPNTTTLQTDGSSTTYGLDYFVSDFAVLKAAASFTNQRFRDSTQNISPKVYELTIDFVF